MHFGSSGCPRPTLVVLTRRYPFGVGEEFFSPELKVLSKRFNVHIVPVSGPLPKPKKLPESVEVHTLWDDGRLATLLAGARSLRMAPLLEDLRDCAQVACRSRRVSGFFGPAARALGEHFLAALLWARISRCSTCSTSTLYYAYWGSSGAVALSLHRAGKFVVRMHGYDLYPERAWGGYIPSQPRILEATRAVLCVSEHGRRYLSSEYPAQREKLHLSRLGVTRQKAARSSQGPGLHIGSISAIVPVKRLHLIAESIAVLRGRGVDARWSHFGSGPDTPKLQDLVDRLGLSSHVEFRGHLRPAEAGLYPALASAGLDVVCNVSLSEGIPVSLMEAASFGIPIVATDVGGSRELVVPANGIMLPSEPTIEEIANALESYAEMPPTVANMASLQAQHAQRTLFDG